MRSKLGDSEDQHAAAAAASQQQTVAGGGEANSGSSITSGVGGAATSSSSETSDGYWTFEKEQQFKRGRQDKKNLYYNEISSSSWNELGFLPFVQKYFIEMKKSMQRGTCICIPALSD